MRPSLFQVFSCVSAHCRASQQLVVPDGGDGGSAEGSDAAEQQRSAQTAAATHPVRCGEAADQLGVHLPLRLPAGLSSSNSGSVERERSDCTNYNRTPSKPKAKGKVG